VVVISLPESEVDTPFDDTTTPDNFNTASATSEVEIESAVPMLPSVDGCKLTSLEACTKIDCAASTRMFPVAPLDEIWTLVLFCNC
jgi:hypothetical protein